MTESIQSILDYLANKPLHIILFELVVGAFFGFMVILIIRAFNRKYIINREDLKNFEKKLDEIQESISRHRNVFDEWERRDMVPMNKQQLKEAKSNLYAFRIVIGFLCFVAFEVILIILFKQFIIRFKILSLIFLSTFVIPILIGIILIFFGGCLFRYFDSSDILSQEKDFTIKKQDVHFKKIWRSNWKK